VGCTAAEQIEAVRGKKKKEISRIPPTFPHRMAPAKPTLPMAAMSDFLE